MLCRNVSIYTSEVVSGVEGLYAVCGNQITILLLEDTTTGRDGRRVERIQWLGKHWRIPILNMKCKLHSNSQYWERRDKTETKRRDLRVSENAI